MSRWDVLPGYLKVDVADYIFRCRLDKCVTKDEIRKGEKVLVEVTGIIRKRSSLSTIFYGTVLKI